MFNNCVTSVISGKNKILIYAFANNDVKNKRYAQRLFLSVNLS